jgi:hypothetical protein
MITVWAELSLMEKVSRGRQVPFLMVAQLLVLMALM